MSDTSDKAVTNYICPSIADHSLYCACNKETTTSPVSTYMVIIFYSMECNENTIPHCHI